MDLDILDRSPEHKRANVPLDEKVVRANAALDAAQRRFEEMTGG